MPGCYNELYNRDSGKWIFHSFIWSKKKIANVPTGLYFAIVLAISNSLKPKYLVFNSLTFRMFPTGH